jgi:hypothetical protein
MNKELKAKWLEALRSGKYEQGQRSLKSLDRKYCCLGVLCDIMDPESWSKAGEHEGMWNSFAESREVLHDTALSRVGLREEEQKELIKMNDGGKSFKEIADHIEANL